MQTHILPSSVQGTGEAKAGLLGPDEKFTCPSPKQSKSPRAESVLLQGLAKYDQLVAVVTAL